MMQPNCISANVLIGPPIQINGLKLAHIDSRVSQFPRVNSFKIGPLITCLQSNNTMRFALYPILAISFGVFLMGTPLIFMSNASSSSIQGYVAYQVTLSKDGNQTNLVVNESTTPTNQNGFVDLTFGLISNLQNLTYSRVVNASSVPEIFPFIPSITNQSFSYETHGISFNTQISTAGTTSVFFKGATYTASKYLVDLSVTNSSSGQSVSATGDLVALPSGLLYSVQLQEANSSTSASIQLVSTNLSLSDPSNAVSTTEGAAMVSAGLLGAAAIAIPWKLRRRKNSAATSEGSEKKPSYWVD